MKCSQHGAYSPECFENLNLVRINFNRTDNYMIYPHQRYKNVEIASVDVEKKVISLTVHYEGNEADLEDYEVQNKLTADVNAAVKHFKDQRFFEDDDLQGWRYPSIIMIHPTITHE